MTHSPFLFKMTQSLNVQNDQLRFCILYDFRSGLGASQSHDRLCKAFGENVVSRSTVFKWYARFKDGDLSIKDEPRSGRPSEANLDELRSLVEANPRQSVRQLATQLNISHTSVLHHLKAMGKVPKLGTWVPRRLTDQDRTRRTEAALSLLSYSRTKNWLSTIITSDEKWVLYDNACRKLQWIDADAAPEPDPKPNLHPRKVMLCVWWDSKGVIHHELLPRNMTITSIVYCEQLQRVNEKLLEIRPGIRQIRYLHDNARPHVAKATREKLLELGWEVLVHPPYSPDMAPTDYHLFNSLSNFLRGRQFADETEVSDLLNSFFASKPQDFYSRGILSLPDRWQRIVQNEGDYIID